MKMLLNTFGGMIVSSISIVTSNSILKSVFSIPKISCLGEHEQAGKVCLCLHFSFHFISYMFTKEDPLASQFKSRNSLSFSFWYSNARLFNNSRSAMTLFYYLFLYVVNNSQFWTRFQLSSYYVFHNMWAGFYTYHVEGEYYYL